MTNTKLGVVAGRNSHWGVSCVWGEGGSLGGGKGGNQYQYLDNGAPTLPLTQQ